MSFAASLSTMAPLWDVPSSSTLLHALDPNRLCLFVNTLVNSNKSSSRRLALRLSPSYGAMMDHHDSMSSQNHRSRFEDPVFHR